MLISRPKRSGCKGQERISYHLTSEANPAISHDVFFEFPSEYSEWVSDGMEAAVTVAMFPAMALHERILIEDTLSPRFHYGLRQVMKYFHLWYPAKFSPSTIECDGFKESNRASTNTVACFSGGVDSFYTWLHHRETVEPTSRYRITHGLFVHGFDIALDRQSFYDANANAYESALGQDCIRLIRCRTNIKEILEYYAPWMAVHGAAIHAVMHLLGGGMSQFIIPSTNRFSLINPPIGSNPITDPQPGTESLHVIHHGCEASRIQKVLAISDWPPAQQHLRVCFQETGGYLNCGRCLKCQKVMLPLWLTDKLERFPCFPSGFQPTHLHPDIFKRIDVTRYRPELSYQEELLELAQHTRPDAVKFLNNCKPASAYSRMKSRFFR